MDERVHLSKVAFDQESATRAGKRLFMCRHQGRSPDVGLDQIAARHDLDIALQEKHDLRWLTYYVNKELGTSFCLAEARSKDDVEACHLEAHGTMLPFRVTEVDWSAVGDFLGDPLTPEPGYPWGETGFRTLLSAQLANLGALAAQHGDATALDAFNHYLGLFRKALSATRGREVRREANRILAAFTSAAAAVECALALQQAVERQNRRDSMLAFDSRIGLNAGEPLTAEGGLFGAAIELASVLGATAPPGATLVSGVVRDLTLGKGFEFVDRGTSAIEGFGDVHVYELRSAQVTPAAPGPGANPDGLSPREVEVLRLIAGGKSNHQIAEALFISQNTVARHVANILNKTGAVNRTEAAAYAYRERLAD